MKHCLKEHIAQIIKKAQLKITGLVHVMPKTEIPFSEKSWRLQVCQSDQGIRQGLALLH